MKLLILANNDVGLYKFRKELLQKFISAEYEVNIALPNGDYIEKLVSLGCRYTEIKLERRGINPLKDFALFCKYLKLLKSIKPDVVLTYTIKPNIYGGMACRIKKIPYISNITGLGTSLENPGMVQKIALSMYRLGIKGAKYTFFQNRNNMEFMETLNIGGGKHCLLPGSGVDIDAHSFQNYPKETETLKFLSVMRIMRDKGIYELLSCAERIKRIYSNASFTLVGGYDDDSYREAVEKAQKEGLIEYLGYRSDIDELMSQHHCIINPSYHEGMSNVLLEAAACGRPVIASNVPGCKETFDEGVSGFGFEVKNTDELVKCVEKFILLPHSKKEEMGMAGRRKVEAEFDREIVVKAYMDCLYDILNHDINKKQ